MFPKKLCYIGILFLAPTFLFAQNEDLPLRWGCDSDYPPLSFMEQFDLHGFDADLAEITGEIIGRDIEMYPGEWSDTVQRLEDGELDIVSGILLTQTRQERISYTIPYLYDSYRIFRNDNAGVFSLEDLKQKRLIILKGDASLENYILPNDLANEWISVNSFTEAFRMLESGDADYTLAPYSLGLRICEVMHFTSVEPLGRDLFPAEYRLAVSAKNYTLLYQLNEALSQLDNRGVLQDIYDRWHFSQNFPQTESELASPVYLPLLLSLSSIILLGMISFWIHDLYKKLHKSQKEAQYFLCFLESALDAIPQPLRFHDIIKGREWENTQYTALVQQFPVLIEWERKLYSLEQSFPASLALSRKEDSTHSWELKRISFGSEKEGVQGMFFYGMDRRENLRLLEQNESLSGQLAEKETLLEELRLSDSQSGLYGMQFLQEQFKRISQQGFGVRETFFLHLEFDFWPFLSRGTSLVPLLSVKRKVRDFLMDNLDKRDIIGVLDSGAFLIVLERVDSKVVLGFVQHLVEMFTKALEREIELGCSFRFRLAPMVSQIGEKDFRILLEKTIHREEN